jgi:hypothetical protein
MTLDLWESLENVVDESFELDLKYLIVEPEVKISAWSGVGTAEMVPEWALKGIGIRYTRPCNTVVKSLLTR